MRTTLSAYYKKNSNPVLWMFPDLQSISDKKRRIGRMWLVFQGKRLKKCAIALHLINLIVYVPRQIRFCSIRFVSELK